MIYIVYLMALGFLAIVLAAIRNDLVFSMRRRAIDAIYESLITDKKVGWDVVDSPTYVTMMWQFHKWSFKQFYPTLLTYDTKEK